MEVETEVVHALAEERLQALDAAPARRQAVHGRVLPAGLRKHAAGRRLDRHADAIAQVESQAVEHELRRVPVNRLRALAHMTKGNVCCHRGGIVDAPARTKVLAGDVPDHAEHRSVDQIARTVHADIGREQPVPVRVDAVIEAARRPVERVQVRIADRARWRAWRRALVPNSSGTLPSDVPSVRSAGTVARHIVVRLPSETRPSSAVGWTIISRLMAGTRWVIRPSQASECSCGRKMRGLVEFDSRGPGARGGCAAACTDAG